MLNLERPRGHQLPNAPRPRLLARISNSAFENWCCILSRFLSILYGASSVFVSSILQAIDKAYIFISFNFGSPLLLILLRLFYYVKPLIVVLVTVFRPLKSVFHRRSTLPRHRIFQIRTIIDRDCCPNLLLFEWPQFESNYVISFYAPYISIFGLSAWLKRIIPS